MSIFFEKCSYNKYQVKIKEKNTKKFVNEINSFLNFSISQYTYLYIFLISFQ